MNRSIFTHILALLPGFMMLTACSQEPENPLLAGDGDTVTVMDFSKPFPLDPPPSGWQHRKFWTRAAMEISFAEKEGIEALQCKTDGSGSIFGRHTDIALKDFPHLSWGWYIEQPIESALDERTREGDDHPARLFIGFETEAGEDHFIEVIWSNRLFMPGDYKYIGDFAHYVANGLDENIKTWHREEIDLLEIYRTTAKRNDRPRLKIVAIFCDSDDTGGSSIAYFSNVRLTKKPQNSGS